VITLSFFFTSCTDNPVITAGKPSIVHKAQIKPLNWTAEFKQKVLAKRGFAGEVVSPDESATIGGESTYGVTLYVPAGAVNEDTYITITVPGGDIAVAEFGPSMVFNTDVTITFPYDALELNGGSPYDLKPIWYNPSTGAWEYINSTVTVDESNRTVSFTTGHFSRYGWSF
jgi:hypothetical protein